VLTKSRGAIAASVLAVAAVGGGSVVVIRAMPAGPVLVAPAAQPSMAGPPATAAVPRGAGGADAAGSGNAGAGAASGGQPGATATGAGAGGAGIPPLSRSAGQGDPGPLPPDAVPADGAVPGASPAIQALAAARAATTALPHSPRLLAQLGRAPAGTAASGAGSGPASPSQGTPVAGASTPAPSPAGPSSPGSSPAASASGSPAASAPAAGATASPAGPAPAAPQAPGQPAGGQAAAVAQAVPAGAQAAGVTGRTLAGLDVAGFQHPVSKQHPGGAAISWPAVAKAGYKFAAVKATEGDYYVNSWAAPDLAGAKAAGLTVTPYHFAVPNASGGAAQAQFAVEYSGYKSGPRTLPLMLDIEYDPYNSTDHANECYGLTAAKMTAWLSAFVAAAHSLTGQYPVIYTTADWWNTCTGKSAAFSADPMWVAAYGVASPTRPAGWHIWTFWQYTSGGTVPGVTSPQTTDLDIFSPSAVGLIDPGAQSAKAGAKVSLPVTSLGAAAGEALTYSAAHLPPGLSLGKGGTVSGTITAAAAPKSAVTYQVTVSAKNSSGATAAVAFSWKVSPAA
jgi:GH25 family lysozyme M1 (1,4-beta-N-acetylmuramidase)